MVNAKRTDVRPRRPPARRRAVLAVLAGFATLIGVGTVLLMTPFASTEGRWTGPVDALFTSVSAASDTGLVIVDTADHWSFFGETVIAALMFIGGIGIMATATLAVVIGRRSSLDRRAQVSDTLGTTLGGAGSIVRRTIAFAILVQLLGTVVLAVLLSATGEASGPLDLVWMGVFNAVSAFNNAGFDLAGGMRGFTVFADDPLVLTTIAALIVVGGLGYLVSADVVTWRGWRRLALETKLVLLVTGALVAIGAIAVALLEWNSPGLAPLASADRLVNSVFMSVSSRSAGYSTVDMSTLRPETNLIISGLMFIGTASGSTGGGIKVNTLAVLVLVAIAAARDRPEPEGFGRRLPRETVQRAITVVFVAGLVTGIGTLLVASLSAVPAGATFFETVSAFGTVGLSVVGTASYDDLARVALAACMFLGRLGPLALVILLLGRGTSDAGIRRPEEPMRVG